MRNKMKNCDLWDRIAADMIDLERRAGGHGKDLQITVLLKLVLEARMHCAEATARVAAQQYRRNARVGGMRAKDPDMRKHPGS